MAGSRPLQTLEIYENGVDVAAGMSASRFFEQSPLASRMPEGQRRAKSEPRKI